MARCRRPRLAEVAARVRVPGRMQVVGEDPLTILDGAHNPSGMAALAAALDDAIGERPLVAVVSVLDDKDAAGMLRALIGKCSAMVCTASRNPRALPPATLASLVEQLHGPSTEVVRDPHAALRARPRARRSRRSGARHRLDLPGGRPRRRGLRPEGLGAVSDERGPSVLAMMALVAVVVALVILVFFALGYAFGRAFL